MALGLDYNGKMRLVLGTKTIMHEQESSFSSTVPMDELASKDIAGKEYNLKDVEWSVSGSGLASNSDADAQMDIKALLEAHLSKAPIPFAMTDEVNGNMAIAGSVYIESVNTTSANQEKVTYDFSLKGIGVYTVGENV